MQAEYRQNQTQAKEEGLDATAATEEKAEEEEQEKEEEKDRPPEEDNLASDDIHSVMNLNFSVME